MRHGKWGVVVAFVCALSACSTTKAARIEPNAQTAGKTTACEGGACAQVADAPTHDTFTSSELGVELDKPEGSGWALATDVISPQGNAIPVVVAHPASGAQIVMQVSDGIEPPDTLAAMLRHKLGEEGSINVGEAAPLQVDCGADAYGFDFSVDGEAKGRVALIQLGEQIVLVVASWPPDAEGRLEKDIDRVVKSVRRPASGVTPTALRPDKA